MSKILGWITFFAGIGIIVWTLYSSFNIFTGKTAIPEIFKFEIQSSQSSTNGKTPTTPEELQKEIGQVIGEQLKKILPVDTLPKLLNLAVWTMLAGVLMLGGSQISSLGIKLLKK